jgi:hypothetical protein
MMKKAQMLALAGREDEAKATVATALASFPTYAKDYLDDIDEDVPQWLPCAQWHSRYLTVCQPSTVVERASKDECAGILAEIDPALAGVA